MNTEDKLIKLIAEAELLLNDRSGLYSEGWISELRRMTELSKAALMGDDVPFVRSHGFFEPRENEAMLHAISHYSMLPSFENNKYGLEECINCFKKNRADLRIAELKLAVRRFKEELESADTSGDIGSLNDKLVRTALNTIAETENADIDKLPYMLVKACDAVRECYSSRVFRSDVDSEADLFLTSEGRKKLKERIKSNASMQATFKTIEEISDYYSTERARMLRDFLTVNTDYEKLNKHFFIWSTTDKVITFHTPRNAEYAKIKFILPDIENEEDGLGHIWIDNVCVASGSGRDWDIVNPGFENHCYGWKPVAIKGSPVMKCETQYPYCGEEKASAYISNATNRDCGAWETENPIKIQPDTGCTIMFLAKIDGKFKKGLKIEIDFFDKVEKKVDTFVHYYNRKSVVREKSPAMTMQADAIMYYLTGDVSYAEKAKNEFIYVLCDFCQGIETWQAYNLRPDGCDAYGAVQGGRIMCSLMSAYTMIKNAVKFTAAEWNEIKSQLRYMAAYLYDGRPRIEMSPENVQSNSGNWQTDMACGLGFLLMAMPKTEESAIMLESVNYFLKSQLTINIGDDGSWPESMRYHFAALMRFAIYAKVLKHMTGEDWFKTTPLVDMFYYPTMMQTPPYEYMDNKISTPSIGDHKMSSGSEFDIFALYYADIYNIDREKGVAVYHTWKKAGCPIPAPNGESVLMSLLLRNECEITEPEPELKSTGDFPDSGVYIMRNNENYCAVMAPYRYISHGHYDIGSFIIYKNNIPIVIDPGIEGYFDSTKDWYVSSSSHSVVQFRRSAGVKTNPDPFDIKLEKTDYSAIHGWNDSVRTIDKPLFISGEDTDSITMQIPDIEGRGTVTRKIEFNKQTECYRVTDTPRGYDGELRFSLVMAMKDAVIDGSTVKCRGHFDIDMDVVFDGNSPEITIERGRSTDQFPHSGTPEALIIRAVAKGGFDVKIYPYKR